MEDIMKILTGILVMSVFVVPTLRSMAARCSLKLITCLLAGAVKLYWLIVVSPGSFMSLRVAMHLSEDGEFLS